MKFTESITENRIYRQMYNRAQNIVCRNIVVYLRRNRFGINRLGLTCTKTVGKAVERNRAKRLMKEAYRLNEEKLKKGFDFIIVARTRAKDASFAEVEKDFLYAAHKLSFLSEDR
ncbi:MAG: ribonuclease P protein component [Clostridia bacterium]|nr:ribonuclease P protein component [Clostridia bacterium]